MADDREVLREVWDGRVPAAFTLAAQEVETLTAPDPFYLMLPRLSYLPVVTDKVRKHFSKFVSSELQEKPMWFEFDGAPVKWHLPVGVLFDQACLSDADLRPPWSLTVRFDKFPSGEILGFEAREDVEAFFMSSVKEADQLKHQGKVVSAMQKKDHNQLWQGLHNDKFDQFWAVNRRLMEVLPGDDCFRHVPVRLFERDRPLLQGLYRAAAASSSSSGEGDSKAKRTLRDLLKEALPDKDPDKVRLVTHGVEPSGDTPLQWMSEHLSYPDNFLYLCVK